MISTLQKKNMYLLRAYVTVCSYDSYLCTGHDWWYSGYNSFASNIEHNA